MSPSQRGGNSPPELVEALALLRSLSCIIDGGAGCCDDDGIPSFGRVAEGYERLANREVTTHPNWSPRTRSDRRCVPIGTELKD